MSQVEELLHQIDELDPVQREDLVLTLSERFLGGRMPQTSVLDFPSIVSTPGVCGGAPRLIRTRIPVWTLERMRQLGVSEIDMLRSFPNLRATDLVQAWSYAARHADEIEKAIRENEEE